MRVLRSRSSELESLDELAGSGVLTNIDYLVVAMRLMLVAAAA
jgi:hypothetical protein